MSGVIVRADTEPAFASFGDPFEISGRGTAVMVKNPGGYPDPAVLVGQDVLIDGERVHVRGVESFAIALPYRDGLDFALVIGATA